MYGIQMLTNLGFLLMVNVTIFVAYIRIRHGTVCGGQVFVRSGWLCLVMDFADGGDLCAAVKERSKAGQLFEESAAPRPGGPGGVGVHGDKMLEKWWMLGDFGAEDVDP